MARILIIDDDTLLAELCALRLRDAGHDVETLGDPALAVRTIAISRPDLVLLDIEMPRVSGLTVLRSMRERWTALELPVLMLTASQAGVDMQEAHQLGAKYLMKPVKAEELPAHVAQALESPRPDTSGLLNKLRLRRA